MKKNISLIILLIIGFSVAQDRLFTYTYQSNVLNKGDKELEVWTTVENTKDDYYRKISNRLEFEIGLGSKLQTSFYVNSKQESFYDDITGEIVMEPTEISFSNEWKYKFTDPIANKLGSSAYFEWTIAPDELELELKLILDKRIGKTTHVLNATFEPEWETTTENGNKITHVEYKYDFNYAFAYEINKNWNLGIEAVNKNVNLKEDNKRFSHSALFLGPVLSYNINKLWVNLTILPQIVNLNNTKGDSGLNTSEFTKFDSRLIFSFQF